MISMSHTKNSLVSRRALGALALVLWTTCSVGAEPQSFSPGWIQLLQNLGICAPQEECKPTPRTTSLIKDEAGKTEQWEPVPLKVLPAANLGGPPQDAIVLFDGRSLDEWVGMDGRSPARWVIRGGALVVDKAFGSIRTRRLFDNYQLHIEWRIPKDITGAGQSRGNSGVFLASTGPGDTGFEIQILDSWNNSTYVNGQAASVYKQMPPLVNASRSPGEWQSYDIAWAAPTFASDGALKTSAYVTVFHNGILVQDHTRLTGETTYIGKPIYHSYDRAPLMLQSHPDPSAPISFRNIWVRPL